jgi:hypothetical protein
MRTRLSSRTEIRSPATGEIVTTLPFPAPFASTSPFTTTQVADPSGSATAGAASGVTAPRPAPRLTVTLLPMTRFSRYIPGSTCTTSQGTAASIAAWIVPYAHPIGQTSSTSLIVTTTSWASLSGGAPSSVTLKVTR